MLTVRFDVCRHGRREVMRRFLAVAAAALAALACPASNAGEQMLDLANHRGRVVIVDFWASWCKPCRQSIPWLNAMHARYGAEGLDVIGVNVDAERGDADRFLREVPITFQIVFDPKGQLASQYKLKGMPTSLVFDRNGALIETRVGFRDANKDEHEGAIRNLLKSNVL